MICLYLWSMLAVSVIHSTVIPKPKYSLRILSRVNISDIPQPFNITCDVRRLRKKSAELPDITGLGTVSIVFSRVLPNGTIDKRRLWASSRIKIYGQKVPKGRHWDIFDINWNSSNVYRQSLRIQVHDAKCDDTGSYGCLVNLHHPSGWYMLKREERLIFKGCP